MRTIPIDEYTFRGKAKMRFFVVVRQVESFVTLAFSVEE